MTVAAERCTMRSSHTVSAATEREITRTGVNKSPAFKGSSANASNSSANASTKQMIEVPGVMYGSIWILLIFRRAEVGGLLWKMCWVNAHRFELVRTEPTMQIQPSMVSAASFLPPPRSSGPQSAPRNPWGSPLQGKFSRTPPATKKAAANHFNNPMLSKPQRIAVISWKITQQAMTMRFTETDTNDKDLLVKPSSMPCRIPTMTKNPSSRRSRAGTCSWPPVATAVRAGESPPPVQALGALPLKRGKTQRASWAKSKENAATKRLRTPVNKKLCGNSAGFPLNGLRTSLM
mmetsp:Transcript_53546/g.143457  ORF Transcript_53546/g.143457 Transcript_53546/m.143457 type:complete len:291 (-) Transcript_53546:198-1070(-)